MLCVCLAIDLEVLADCATWSFIALPMPKKKQPKSLASLVTNRSNQDVVAFYNHRVE